ncbi:MAG: leucine-rich repeat domain-containing protein [Alistipes sp.]
MKKFLLFFAVVATMFAACTKDATKDLVIDRPIDNPTDAPIEKFYVTVGDDDSRVQLDDKCQTVWNTGDQVLIFNKTDGDECWQFTGSTGDTTGELVYVDGGTTGSAIDKVVALYPYDSAAVLSEGLLQTTIPTTQTYIKDSFGEGGSIMVARSNDEKLWFRNVMGWIRLSLTGDQIVKAITLKGCNNEPLAGSATIDDDLSITLADDATDTLTLDCGEGVQLTDEPTYFYIAVAPQTFGNGFYAEAVDADNNIILLKTVNSVTVQRNHIVSMGQSELPLPTGPFHNQIWYTTSDDSIITPQSYQGNIVSNTYTDGKGVITFDCAQTTIGSSAFYNCRGLTSITMPDSITEIGYAALMYCTGLKSATIPDSVTKIGEYAFSDCTGMTSVTIPDSVTEIGNYAFENCTGELYLNCNIQDSSSVRATPFYGSRFTKVTIGDCVTSIGSDAFSNSYSLAGVYITDIAAWCKIEFGNTVANPLYYAKKLYLNGELITDLVIPGSITEIGDYAFYYCTGLTSVTIPDSVTAIGQQAFSGCTGLKSFYGKFASNDNRCLIIDGELQAFAPVGLTAYTIPDSVTAIGSGVFRSCTGLKSVTIGNSVTSIGNYALSGCTKLTSITIPDSVTEIGNYAFWYCGQLTIATIGKSVASIGNSAFWDCTRLTSIYCKPTTPPTLGSDAFDDVASTATIYVPTKSVSAYKSATTWSSYSSMIVGYDF